MMDKEIDKEVTTLDKEVTTLDKEVTTLDKEVTTLDKEVTTLKHYVIESIQASEPPLGTEGSNWFQYVIIQGANRISGYRQGDLESVRISTEENVALLNERQFGKRGHTKQTTVTKK